MGELVDHVPAGIVDDADVAAGVSRLCAWYAESGCVGGVGKGVSGGWIGKDHEIHALRSEVGGVVFHVAWSRHTLHPLYVRWLCAFHLQTKFNLISLQIQNVKLPDVSRPAASYDFLNVVLGNGCRHFGV